MELSGIICEYNPFHNGHKYQINKIKEHTKGGIVAIVSGNFTQRGDVAIVDKFTRTKWALENGIDLVIELPTVFAMSSAENFGKGGVQIANAIGCNELSFGIEEDNQDLIIEASKIFENPQLNNHIKALMKDGYYYPQAVECAVKNLYNEELANVINKPNNTLAVEYLKAMKSTDIKPFMIKRAGTEHHDNFAVDNFASGSYLREMIYNNKPIENYVPKYNKADFENIAHIKNLERILLYKLKNMSTEEIKNLPDVSEGLENRIAQFAKTATSIDELFNNIKTKRYTMARLRRIILSSALNINKSITESVPYVRILGFNDTGKKILSQINDNCTLPIIVNVAKDYKKLNEQEKSIFDIDLNASNLYSLATNNITSSNLDFTKGIIKT